MDTKDRGGPKIMYHTKGGGDLCVTEGQRVDVGIVNKRGENMKGIIT